jgi:hypothetical protein
MYLCTVCGQILEADKYLCGTEYKIIVVKVYCVRFVCERVSKSFRTEFIKK